MDTNYDSLQREFEKLNNENKLKNQKFEEQAQQINDLQNEIVKLKKAGEGQIKLKEEIEMLSGKLKIQKEEIARVESELVKSEHDATKLRKDLLYVNQKQEAEAA